MEKIIEKKPGRFVWTGFFCLLLISSTSILAQTASQTAANANLQSPDTETADQKNARMEWWRKARFGMFIHWGVYAVPAGRYHGKIVQGFYNGRVVPSAGEWIMHDGKIPRKEYQQFARSFNPLHFDADTWVSMAKAAGMRYIVITSKHHDGFALFDSKASDWNVVKATPYGRDIIRQIAEACRRQGMKLGLYYSQANDWNNPGGAAEGGHWDSTQNGSMDAYLENVAIPQVREILGNYGDVAELWWDVPTGMTAERAAKFLPLVKMQPGIITNNRLGGNISGDIETPEQNIPATGIPGRDWETCMTINDTWGFKLDDHNWKSSRELIQNLIDIASKGGNYLLNVGPNAAGEFPAPIVKRLKAIGAWMQVNSEAIYGTNPSPFRKLDWGRCTRKINDDGSVTLYFEVFWWPKNGLLKIPDLRSRITRATMLATGTVLKSEETEKGLQVHVPLHAPDIVASVVKLELDGPLRVDDFSVDASPDGSYHLDADFVDIHNRDSTTERIGLEGPGSGIPDRQKQHIAFWSDPQNWVSWMVRIKKPGTYNLKTVLAGPVPSGKMKILVGDQQLMVEKKATGGYYRFKTFPAGQLVFDKPGAYRLTVQPIAEDWKPFNLKEIVLNLADSSFKR